MQWSVFDDLDCDLLDVTAWHVASVGPSLSALSKRCMVLEIWFFFQTGFGPLWTVPRLKLSIPPSSRASQVSFNCRFLNRVSRVGSRLTHVSSAHFDSLRLYPRLIVVCVSPILVPCRNITSYAVLRNLPSSYFHFLPMHLFNYMKHSSFSMYHQ